MHLLSVHIEWMTFNQNIDDYNSSRKKKILIVFDDMIAGNFESQKILSHNQRIVIRCRKLNKCLSLSLIFLFQKMSE